MKKFVISVLLVCGLVLGLVTSFPVHKAYAAINPNETYPAGCYDPTTGDSVACPGSGSVDQFGNPIQPTANCYEPTEGPVIPGQTLGVTEVNCTGLTEMTTTTSSSQGSAVPNCEATGLSLSWIVCPVISMISDAETAVESVVTSLLQTQPINFNARSTSTNRNDKFSATVYSVWSDFRFYGDIVLVIAILGIVYSEVTGGGIIDTYTAKKMLPRILIAAILINLSIYIVAALEDVTNVVGVGIGSLIDAPFQALGQFHITLNGGTGDLAFGLGLAGVLALTLGGGIIGILLLVFGTALLAAFGVLLTLMFRQGLLVILILTSPVAFALYCLPNTEQYFRRWWNLLLKTLLVFPIVIIIFAIANISGVVTGNLLSGNSGGAEQVLFQLMGLFAEVVPLFLIPFAFRLAGGAIGEIHKAVSGVTDRLNRPIAEARKGNRAQRGERARDNNLFRGDGRLAKKASYLAQGVMLAPKAGLRPSRMKANLGAARSARTTMLSGKAGESIATAAITGNDDLETAALAGQGTEADARAYLERIGQRGNELEQNISSINQARREMGREAFEDFVAANLAGTGTGYASGPAEMLQTINRVAGSDRARATRILNSARGQAERARRVDLYGAGFATSADSMAQLAAGQTTAAEVNEVMTDEALTTKSASEIATGRNNALTNMIGTQQNPGAIMRRLTNAQYAVGAAQSALSSAQLGGNPASITQARNTLDTANHEFKRVMAHTSSFLDIAGNASSENSQMIGALMGQNVGMTGQTIGQTITTLESDPEFQQYKKVYGVASAAANAAGQGIAGGPQQPPRGP